MNMHILSGLFCGVLLSASFAVSATTTAIDNAVSADTRPVSSRVRDVYRHPAETLEFFGVKPDMTVVEIWPGGGWYSEILGPLLRQHGTYYAAGFVTGEENTPAYFEDSMRAYLQKVNQNKAAYGRVIVTQAGLPNHFEFAPAGSADRVLTFRNVHNWYSRDYADQMFSGFLKALKPGGVLGVVEHRAKADATKEFMKTSGYMTEQSVIDMALKAGFVLEARSEINANPNDSTVHPKGVWTLPPSLRLGDVDREKYLAIGESDRMTLRFRKP